MRLPECLDGLGGSLYRRLEISSANRLVVACRASWRRRALADELVDELGLFHERAGALVWLGRRRPGQEPTVAGR